MKVVSLELNGFRAFAQQTLLDLDADAVIVVGANGCGKTSIFDALLWAMTGRVTRLRGDENIISMYSASGEARVSVGLLGDDGKAWQIVRRFDGEEQFLQVEIGGESLRGPSATARMTKELWPEGESAHDGSEAMNIAITRSVYLQQDLVREFIESDTDQERFRTVSELVGAGILTELALQLERARTQWTTVTNVRAREVQECNQRLASLNEQVSRITGSGGPDWPEIMGDWQAWWAEARQLGLDVEGPPSPGVSEAGSILDAAMKSLGVLRQSHARRRESATDLLSFLENEPAVVAEEDASILRNRLETAEQEADALRQALARAQEHAAAERHSLVERRETHEELQALARLALRHLGSRCPVCEQQYDVAKTRERLEKLASDYSEEEPLSALGEVASLSKSLEGHEQAMAELQARIGQVETASRTWRMWKAELDRRATELELHPNQTRTNLRVSILRVVDHMEREGMRLVALEELGEKLSLKLAGSADQARRVEMERQVLSLSGEAVNLEQNLRLREETGRLANQILEGVREVGSVAVAEQVERLVPLLQRIYTRVDPHPAFKAVRFLTRVARGRGRLAAEISDPAAGRSSESPEHVLSSSQANALAVAIYFALNLGVRTPLSAALLDDPLQSLDDINLLGLVDLLRRAKDRRQLIVSTHDARFGRLLELKLRPIGESQRTRVIELGDWTRDGPKVTQRDVLKELKPLRIAT